MDNSKRQENDMNFFGLKLLLTLCIVLNTVVGKYYAISYAAILSKHLLTYLFTE